jgi:anthranilate phosphoribosyltransferase
VVNSADGLDELSISAPNFVARLRNGQVRAMTIDALDYGLERTTLDAVRGGDAQENAQITRDVLAGTRGPQRDIVLLNAGMALVAAGVAEDPQEGLDVAAEAIDTGRAAQVLDELIALTQGLA